MLATLCPGCGSPTPVSLASPERLRCAYCEFDGPLPAATRAGLALWLSHIELAPDPKIAYALRERGGLPCIGELKHDGDHTYLDFGPFPPAGLMRRMARKSETRSRAPASWDPGMRRGVRKLAHGLAATASLQVVRKTELRC